MRRPRGQFVDQVSQGTVVGVSSSLGAQEGNDVAGDVLPVDQEIGRAAIHESTWRRSTPRFTTANRP
jgi:hypothetical protein